MEVVNLYFDISIHAPREGGDLIVNTITKDCLTNFNPRPPRGGRQRCPYWGIVDMVFQSTPPARGATLSKWYNKGTILFQSTPPARGATVFDFK